MKNIFQMLLIALASKSVFAATLTYNDSLSNGGWSTTSERISSFFDSRKRFDLSALGNGEYVFTISFDNPDHYYWSADFWFSNDPNDGFLQTVVGGSDYPGSRSFATNNRISQIGGAFIPDGVSSYIYNVDLDGGNQNYLFLDQYYEFYSTSITYEQVPLPAAFWLFVCAIGSTITSVNRRLLF